MLQCQGVTRLKSGHALADYYMSGPLVHEMKMKKTAWILLILVFVLNACGGPTPLAISPPTVQPTAPPLSPDQSQTARAQVRLWSDLNGGRMHVARKMYAMRFGEVLPHDDIAVLRGIEGARAKESYRSIAQQFGIVWDGRRYDRQNPDATDAPNQAINHAATAVEAAAMIAVAATGTIPSLGFIHEDSGMSWTLDIADLMRSETTLPIAFGALKAMSKDPSQPLERHVRRVANRVFRERQLISTLIERIQALLDVPNVTT